MRRSGGVGLRRLNSVRLRSRYANINLSLKDEGQKGHAFWGGEDQVWWQDRQLNTAVGTGLDYSLWLFGWGTSEWTGTTCQYLAGKEGQVVQKRIILKWSCPCKAQWSLYVPPV